MEHKLELRLVQAVETDSDPQAESICYDRIIVVDSSRILFNEVLDFVEGFTEYHRARLGNVESASVYGLVFQCSGPVGTDYNRLVVNLSGGLAEEVLPQVRDHLHQFNQDATILQYTAYTNNQGKEVECGLKRVEGALDVRVKAIKQALQGLDIRGMDNLDRINTLVLDIDTPRGRQELNLGFRGGLATEVTDKVFEFIDLQLGAM